MSNPIISRRKLLASLGAAGAAFAVERLATGSGGMQAIAGSVAQNVYGNEEAEGCQPSGCAVLDVKSFGATGDGVTDDTAAIQLALDSLEERQTLCFPAGTYLLSGVTVTTRHIRLEGEHAILRLTDKTKNVFNLVAADGLRLHGFTADYVLYGADDFQIQWTVHVRLWRQRPDFQYPGCGHGHDAQLFETPDRSEQHL